jgi:hypothetical protein
MPAIRQPPDHDIEETADARAHAEQKDAKHHQELWIHAGIIGKSEGS